MLNADSLLRLKSAIESGDAGATSAAGASPAFGRTNPPDEEPGCNVPNWNPPESSDPVSRFSFANDSNSLRTSPQFRQRIFAAPTASWHRGHELVSLITAPPLPKTDWSFAEIIGITRIVEKRREGWAAKTATQPRHYALQTKPITQSQLRGRLLEVRLVHDVVEQRHTVVDTARRELDRAVGVTVGHG